MNHLNFYDLSSKRSQNEDVKLRALIKLGMKYNLNGHFKAAKAMYIRALGINPDYHEASFNLARLEHDCGHYEQARYLYHCALSNADGMDEHFLCTAYAYLGLLEQQAFGNFEKARACYDWSLERIPNHVLTLDHMCTLLALTGEKAAAEVLHKIVCKLDGHHCK